MNPFSNRGQIHFSTFLITIVAAVAFNFLTILAIRGHLIGARARGDISMSLGLYAVWFVLFGLGFYIVSNTFAKRWAAVLGDKNLGSFWKLIIRLCLLSPVLSYTLSLLTMLYFPGSPFRSTGRGGSKFVILIFVFVVLTASVVFVVELPATLFGLERTNFQEASKKFNLEPIELPSDRLSSTGLAVASPTLRYLSWLTLDFVRARAIMTTISTNPVQICSERLGYIGVEVDDCFFRNFRASSETAPMISPYFGLYFETKYRQQTAKDRTPVGNLAINLLMLSNLLELAEPGVGFVDRRHLLEPAPLLFGFGSPEVPLVELGQDFQRMMLIKRLLPVFDLQISTAREFMKQENAGAALISEGADATSVEAELRDLQIRIDAIRRDPVGIAAFEAR